MRTMWRSIRNRYVFEFMQTSINLKESFALHAYININISIIQTLFATAYMLLHWLQYIVYVFSIEHIDSKMISMEITNYVANLLNMIFLCLYFIPIANAIKSTTKSYRCQHWWKNNICHKICNEGLLCVRIMHWRSWMEYWTQRTHQIK